MKKTTDTKIYKRLLVIALRGEGKTNLEITGFAIKYVPQIISKYVKQGIESITHDKRTTNNRKVSIQEEQHFLQKYEKKAMEGQIITVKEMRLDFQDTFNVTIRMNSFYKLLHRNNWRKVTPRSRHPKKADAKKIEASKKLTL